MRWRVIAPAVLALSCHDASAPCEKWGGCYAGLMVVRVTVLDDFPAKHLRSNHPVFGPNDTITLRFSVENQSSAATDSFTLQPSFGDYRRDNVSSHVLQFKQHFIPALEPNQRFVFVDTSVIAPETRATTLPFNRKDKWSPEVTVPDAVRLTGDTILQVLSSGFELETLLVPNQEQVLTAWGTWITASRVRSSADWGFVIRIRNPYEVLLQPMRLRRCVIDLDYCPRAFTQDLDDLTPPVPPGEYRDFDVMLNLVSTAYLRFWNYLDGVVTVCYPRWLSGTCTEANIRLIPDIEGHCTVAPVQLDVPVFDDVADCEHEGSAYRFSARAGEHYRVESSPAGNAFITGAEGKNLYSDEQKEMTISKDGPYYVILDQVVTKATSFTLKRE